MLEITVSNSAIFPLPENTIYRADIIEPMRVRFYLDADDHRIIVHSIEFISSEFICNSVSDKLIEEWREMYLSNFQFHQFNRDVFFPLSVQDKLKYQCTDAACHLANEYSARLNNQPIIYYFSNHAEDTITACVKKQSLFMELDGENASVATDEYIEIGELKICETDDGLRWLDYLEIDSDYQSEVSKFTMVKLAVKQLHMNAVACVKNDDSYRFYLLDDAEESFIYDCLIKDIITCEMCYFSIHSNYQSSPFILNEGVNDPGKDSELLMQLNPPMPRAAEIDDIHSPIGSPLPNGIF